jgi:protein ImuA
MSKGHRLDQLLKNRQIWKAGRNNVRCDKTLSTGFADLDRALSGGWPVGVLTELLVDFYGIGELRLLMPTLAELSRESGKWVMLIAPPYIPYAPAITRQGMNISRLLLVRCRHPADVLWTMEQALRSGTCAAVLAWSDRSDQRSLRRLQLAAEEGSVEKQGCWAVLFRPSRFSRHRSPAALRIGVRPVRLSRVGMNIFKNRSGRPLELEIPLPDIR